jgi:hypothetical protein
MLIHAQTKKTKKREVASKGIEPQFLTKLCPL